MKQIILLLALGWASIAQADINWEKYSDTSVAQALKENKKVVLGFHKKGCGTCKSQDSTLYKTGISKSKDIAFFVVERKDEDLTPVYEKYGFGQRQWAALVMIDKNGEISRVEPGNTNSKEINLFAAKATK